MLTDVRHQRIADWVRREGSVSVLGVADAFGVSEATARRDLDQLASTGVVERIRGGARALRRPIRPEADASEFAVVAAQESDEKRAIAKRAAALVHDGDVVALDIGTTVFAMCEHLKERSITVVTASLAVVRALSDAPHIDIVVMGGVLRPNYDSLVGVLTESCLRQVRVDIAFLGAAGIHADGAVIDSTPSEVPIKRAMIDVARKAWLLADHQKFPGMGFLQVVPIDRFAGLITDRPPSSAQLHLPPDSTLEVLTP